MTDRVIGVDGCKGGWIAVIWGDTLEHRLCQTFAEVLELNGRIIAVDMPMGLPELSRRTAEREVRAKIGKRRSSVFTVPSRAAIECQDYREACEINLKHSAPPRMFSLQAFHLFPKIREIDKHLNLKPELQSCIFEVHPELSFWAMNGGTPLEFPKKVRNRVSEVGLAFRRHLLEGVGFPLGRIPTSSYRRKDVQPDDLLDACACAWSARRILEGRAVTFPAKPETDARGLRMQISA